MNITHDLDFGTVERVLAQSGASADAADSHGFLCGLVCAAGYAEPASWEPELLGEGNAADKQDSRQMLQRLYEQVQIKLSSPDLDFQLLLPDEDEPLALRTETLGQWVLGFLSGLGISGLPSLQALSDESSELIEDFTRISQLGFDLENPTEDDEAAFYEIVEFVKVGVLYLLEELQPATASSKLQ